jgi:hypothetical protein
MKCPMAESMELFFQPKFEHASAKVESQMPTLREVYYANEL